MLHIKRCGGTEGDKGYKSGADEGLRDSGELR